MDSSLDLSLAIHKACNHTTFRILEIDCVESPEGPFLTVDMVSENPSEQDIIYSGLAHKLQALADAEDYKGMFKELVST